ncbi:MAG: hypothetical protein Kow00107_00140 [Planctomycetota bacterium]
MCMLLAVSMASAETVDAPAAFICDFHSHCAAADGVGDAGTLSPEKQLELRAKAGYQVVFWTPHSNLAWPKGKDPAPLARLLKRIPLLKSETVTWFGGVEYHVANGPKFSSGMLGNNNHLSFIGISEPIPDGLSYVMAIEYLHALGGVTVVNHPGPGPLEWEPGYYETGYRLSILDGFECFNGRLVYAGHLEDSTYRTLVAKGARLAAIGSTDFHYPADPLGAGTSVFAKSSELADLVAAVSERKTVALTDTSLAPKHVEYLGEVRMLKETGSLSIELGYVADKLILFRGEEIAGEWKNAGHAEFKLLPGLAGAYSWVVQKGKGRFQSSAIWLLDSEPKGADLQLSQDGGMVTVTNVGNLEIECEIREYDAAPHKGGKVVKSHPVRIAPGENRVLPSKLRKGAFVVANPAGYSFEAQGPEALELDYRNNAILVK